MYKQKIKLLNVLLSLLLILPLSINTVSTVYATPGDLDPTFGVGGKVITHITDSDSANSVALQPDGKIVIVGSVIGAGGRDFILARYNPNGSLDQNFSGDGKVETDFSTNGIDTAFAVAIQTDSKIVVAGETRVTSGTYNGLLRVAIARYNSDGSLDTSFGSGGKVTTAYYNNDTAYAYDLVIQSDGKLVAAGVASVGGATGGDYALFRYNTDGSLDTNFGNGGIVTTSFTSGGDAAKSLVIQSDGKLVAAGRTSGDAQSEFGLVRYNSNGSLDSTFGIGGKTTTSFDGGYGYANSLTLQSDGKLIAGGYVNISNRTYSGLVRYNSDGSLDSTFGTNGKVITDFGGSGNWVNSLVIQPNDKIVTLGNVILNVNNEYQTHFGLARYNIDGSLDFTFGTEGKITTSFGGVSLAANSLALQSDEKLVAVGTVTFESNSDFALARYEGGDNTAPTANAGQDQTGNEGNVITFDGTGSTDPDGVSNIVSYNWNFGDGATGSEAIVSHTYADNGIYTAILTVTDSAGAASTDTAIVTINNVIPIVGEITAPLTPQQTGTAVNANASFTDPGIVDTHTAVWNWGDGTTSSGTVTESGGSGLVTGSHTYSTPGVYTLTLTVTDKDGGFATKTFQYIVIYNPNGGFVTGGGWIDNGSGKVNFGFNSKYANGATVPTGQTQLNFKLADFNFHSTSYEWLIVSGSKAQFKGSGTVNGTGDYSFILTANDGPDKFRLKVWDKTTGNVLYDTQPGDADNADASTALGGGNVIIHN